MVYVAYYTEDYDGIPQCIMLGVYNEKTIAYNTIIRDYVTEILDFSDDTDTDIIQGWFPCQHAKHTFHLNYCDVCKGECQCPDKWKNFKTYDPVYCGSKINTKCPGIARAQDTICFQWSDRTSIQTDSDQASIVHVPTGEFVENECGRYAFVSLIENE